MAYFFQLTATQILPTPLPAQTHILRTPQSSITLQVPHSSFHYPNTPSSRRLRAFVANIMSFEFATMMPAQRFPPVDLARRVQSKYLEDYEVLHDILVYATCAIQRYGLCSILYNHLMSVIKNGINEWKNKSRSANAILHDLLEKERDVINDYNKGSLSSELSTMHHTDPIAELWTSIPTPRVIPDVDQSFPIRVASVTMGMGITELTALDQIDLPDDSNVFPNGVYYTPPPSPAFEYTN